MRMNYKTYPTDYVQELKSLKNNRKKARCFQEYFDDMEHEDHNSYGFYAKSWDVSKSTAHTWIDEFKHEISLFVDHWYLKNQQHYSYAKNQAERQPNDNRTTKSSTSPKATEFENIDRTTTERQPNEALNYTNKNNAGFLFDKDYNDFYFIYSRNTNYPGSKPEAYDAFARTDINVDLLKLACMKYLNDKSVQRPVGVKKFLENEMYQPYLPKYMKVKSGDDWYAGVYDTDSYELKSVDGVVIGTITPELLVKLFEKNELVYLKNLK